MQTRYLGSTSILRIRRADVDIYGYVAKELAKMAIKSQLLSGLRSIYFNRTTKDERFTRLNNNLRNDERYDGRRRRWREVYDGEDNGGR